MSKVGLVLGGGGITGAAFHLGTLLALEMATGWPADEAEVVVGTSGGAAVAALVRAGRVDLDGLMGDASSAEDLTERLRSQLFTRGRPGGVLRWVRHGLLPGARRPGFSLVLGSPAPYRADGIAEWVEERVGSGADTWPARPTLIVAYDLEARRRVVFGTDDSPDVPLKLAVAASSAVPLIYEPVRIDGHLYIDGGVASGTSADLVLGNPEPLDLVLVLAPMASDEPRDGARFYEDLVDRAGRDALDGELERIRSRWPETDILVLKPDAAVMAAARPNPLSPEAAVPSFLHTLRSLRDELGRPEVWSVLQRHLLRPVQA